MDDFDFDFDLPPVKAVEFIGPRMPEGVRLARVYAQPHIKARMKVQAERQALKRIKDNADFDQFLADLAEESAE